MVQQRVANGFVYKLILYKQTKRSNIRNKVEKRFQRLAVCKIVKLKALNAILAIITLLEKIILCQEIERRSHAPSPIIDMNNFWPSYKG